MARFTGKVSKAVTSTSVGVGALQNSPSGPLRMKLLELTVGSDAATLGTSNFRWDVQRNTTAPTGTNVTPTPLDSQDPASFSTSLFSSLTANGTLGAVVLTIPISEQATFKWTALPGSEIIIPAAANNGIHFMTPVCGNTPSAAAQVTFEEE